MDMIGGAEILRQRIDERGGTVTQPRKISRSNQVGPHPFRPLARRDRWRKNGRCEACYLPKSMHPMPGYVPSRPLGDDRPAEATWEALGDAG